VKTIDRVGALALATATTIALAAPAAYAQSQFQALDSPTGVSPKIASLGGSDADRGGTARTAATIATAMRTRAWFPVRGPFNWGQEQAAFGAGRSGHMHEGQDVLSRTGTPEVAVRSGEVLETGNDGGRGNYLNLYDPAARVTYVYMHMEQPASVHPGEHVTGGQRVGAVGCSGSCFGDHLHFEIHAGRGIQGPARDPKPDLERWAAADHVPATLPPGQS
jgi:murein DD-endopeptidase MepM/ murein hydrolase activator NlpD